MRRLGLRPEEFEEVFSRSSGPGGQHVNKVSTAVTLVHLPSGISLTVQDTRSQYRNRQLAVHRLMTLIDQKRKREISERRAEVERILEHIDGDHMLLFATDFPHWHFDGTGALPPGLSPGLVRRITVENPLATYPRLQETLS